MRLADLLLFNWKLLRRHGVRTLLLLLAMSIGVAAVNLLTGLGEGARGYVLGEFSSLGNNILIMMPGKRETTGGMPPIMGVAPRQLTLTDARALSRVPGVARVAPLIVGSSQVSRGSLNRDTVIVGTHADFFAIRKLSLQQGDALPAIPLSQAQAVCVIGRTIKQAMFGNQPALGEWLRAGDRRFRVIGILGSKGQSLGMNFDEAMLIPVASAQALFNQEGLFRIFLEVKSQEVLEPTRLRILKRISELHEGKEDVTLITQDSLLSAFNKIIATMTLAVGGIAAISLLVAGVLIMNVMLISVSQRTPEIGLLKALGASSAKVRAIFLSEAFCLAAIGALSGLIISESGLWLARQLYPQIPFGTPWWAKLTSVTVAMATALLFALLPAQRAARMAPVDALQSGRGV